MDILKLVVDFIREHHPEAGPSIKDYSRFIETPGDKHHHGYASTVLTGYNWEINIGHAVTPRRVYRVTAKYNDGEIVWNGRIIDRQVEETSYERNPR
jgi:hypothetical protein